VVKIDVAEKKRCLGREWGTGVQEEKKEQWWGVITHP